MNPCTCSRCPVFPCVPSPPPCFPSEETSFLLSRGCRRNFACEQVVSLRTACLVAVEHRLRLDLHSADGDRLNHRSPGTTTSRRADKRERRFSGSCRLNAAQSQAPTAAKSVRLFSMAATTPSGSLS